ncbi:signal recognition particle protein [Zavarzinia aquatilis]|uniref:Signal recognition particle protein n=1 Tax=Zavarzinia aquatilis TaxID=2211142 RepID=A0A317E2H7_9PROT|nr:signal recognition particle protein [Zavarzinia aquatilis]PWR20356.1 signal recognition particle protein [Zavarzinia aquatilis]
MFESLSDRLSDVFGRLTKKGALTDSDVAEAMREVRLALLEADVALPVVKDFVAAVKEKAIGQDVVRSVTPGQMVIKIVHDHLVEVLGGADGATDIDLNAVPPVPIMMVGLQGSGKTTTTAKIAYRLTNRDKKKVLMASLDVRRPAAQEQLKVLGEQAGVATLPIIAGQSPVDIAKRALTAARLQGFDVVILDTAGRLHIDEALMQEIEAVKRETNPHEVMLVADSLTGQDAVTVAKQFHDRIGLTGIALTRVDGDGRGGAALSMRAVTGVPLKLMGLGEKIDALEVFHADRIANRILGMGDIVSLVEKAAETIDQQEAEKMAAKLAKGTFDLDDLANQLRQMRKMGGMQGMLAMLPGVAKMKDQLAKANIDDKAIKRQEAIISSMTPKERKNPQIIQAKRKVRIAKGSGTSVQDVNKLLKQHQQMADMMKRMAKLGKKGLMRGGLGALFGGGGGMPPGGFGGPGGGFPPGGFK